MTKSIEERVYAVVEQEAGRRPADDDADSHSLNMDSLDEFVLYGHVEFTLECPDDDAAEWHTVKDIISAVTEKLQSI